MKKIATLCALLLIGAVSFGLLSAPARADSLDSPRLYRQQVVPNGDSVRYEITFRGGELAGVMALGDGDIDILVYDENGNLVEADLEADSAPFCFWWPRRTQTYTIEVMNNKHASTRFGLLTN